VMVNQNNVPDVTAVGNCTVFGGTPIEVRFAGRADYAPVLTGDARTDYPLFNTTQQTAFDATFIDANTLTGGTTGSWANQTGTTSVDWTATFEVTR